MEQQTMTHEEFMELYRPFIGEHPVKIPLKYDGYKLVFSSGDVYIHEETLKTDVAISRYFGAMADDFNYRNYWNGVEIVGYK